MAKKKTLDIKGMRERIAENEAKQSEQFRADLRAMTNKNAKQQEEAQALWNKAMQSEHDEAEKIRAAEIETEKAKAIKEVEAKYEERGVKSEHTQKREAGLKRMLKNLKGMDD